jgi:manganese/zinc/iron transport system substrate-binding protein
MKLLNLLVLAVAVCVGGPVGCGTEEAGGTSAAGGGAGSAGKISVVATTTMIGDLVRDVGADHVALGVVIGPGIDPHTFKPSPADVASLKRADVVFYNGLHLEGKMVELLESHPGEGKRRVAVTRDVPEDRLLGNAGSHDPHVWFDPTIWEYAAKAVVATLAEADPAHASDYARRGEAVVAKLRELHAGNVKAFESLPKEKRILVTSHDAYNYFGRAYEVTVFGLQGISTETEAGLSNVNNAVSFILKNKMPAIFVESSVSPKTIERVRDDCRAKGWDVKIGGELFSDALGSPGQHPGYAVETYEGMMKYNVATIVGALK